MSFYISLVVGLLFIIAFGIIALKITTLKGCLCAIAFYAVMSFTMYKGTSSFTDISATESFLLMVGLLIPLILLVGALFVALFDSSTKGGTT